MKQSVFAAAAVAMLITSPAVFAEEDTSSVRYVMKGCKLLADGNINHSWAHMDADTTRQLWMCAGAMKATSELMHMHHKVCPPSNEVKNEKGLKIISDYMQHHPEQSQEGFTLAMFRALQEAWPCAKAPQ
jgi:hypothetical protein